MLDDLQSDVEPTSDRPLPTLAPIQADSSHGSAFLCQVDLQVLAIDLQRRYDEKFSIPAAVAWLIRDVGDEKSPFVGTDQIDWFYAVENPAAWLMPLELLSTEIVPLQRIGRKRLDIETIRENAALQASVPQDDEPGEGAVEGDGTFDIDAWFDGEDAA